MTITALFGRRLRSLRKAAGLTQQALGERAGMSYKFLGGVERGEENPSLRVVEKLARALKVDIRDMFEVEHEETSPATLRKKADALLRGCDARTLQQAVRLLRAILR